MEGFLLQTEAGAVAVSCSDSKTKKVLSLFGESLRLNKSKVSLKINNHIVLRSAGRDIKAKRFNNMVNNKNGNKIFLELDPEDTPRIFMRDGTPVRNNDGSVNYLSEEEWMWRQLSRLSALIGSCFFESGGFLIHSGLAKFQPEGGGESKGVLLAGASGAGKSTACGMFRPPWYPLSDDLVLIVKDKKNKFLAHPFPTWSRILWKDDEVIFTIVDFDNPVELSNVIFLDRGPEPKLENVGRGRAICLLTELVKQANEHLLLNINRNEISDFNRNYFLNLNKFVRDLNLNSYNLKIDDTFWEEIEKLPEFRT